MRTIVLQSFRDHNIPPWIERCMLSVRNWAENNGYEYQFVGDKIFDSISPALKLAMDKRNIPFVTRTDLARLYWIEKVIEDNQLIYGYDPTLRVTWMDADVLIFRPDNFVLQPVNEYNFVACQEVWHERDILGASLFVHKINNAVMSFSDLGPLRMYIKAAEYIVLKSLNIEHVMIGPVYLTNLYKETGAIGIQRSVGCFSDPTIQQILKRGTKSIAKKLNKAYGCWLAAANLTNSYKRSDADMYELVTRLLSGRRDFEYLTGYDVHVKVGDSRLTALFRPLQRLKQLIWSWIR